MKRIEIWITLGLGVLGVAGTLFGVWLGSHLERDKEDRIWRRDHGLEAYADVLSASDKVLFEAIAAHGIECGTSDNLQQSEIILEKVWEMYRASDRATLLGPNTMQQPLDDLVLYLGTEIGQKSVACPKPSTEEWREARNGAASRYAAFRNEARNDLGLHPHTLDEWGRILGLPQKGRK